MRVPELKQYLESLKSRSVKLWIEEEELLCEAPTGAITDIDFSVLSENKQKIIKLLAEATREDLLKEEIEENSNGFSKSKTSKSNNLILEAPSSKSDSDLIFEKVEIDQALMHLTKSRESKL